MANARDRVRRRYRLVEQALGEVDRFGVVALADLGDEIEAEYGAEGLGGFLADVHSRWRRAFDARLDAVLEDGTGSPDAVARLRRDLAGELPATRLVLDAHAEHPTVRRARSRHRAMLVATGVDVSAIPGTAQTKSSHSLVA